MATRLDQFISIVESDDKFAYVRQTAEYQLQKNAVGLARLESKFNEGMRSITISYDCYLDQIRKASGASMRKIKGRPVLGYSPSKITVRVEPGDYVHGKLCSGKCWKYQYHRVNGEHGCCEYATIDITDVSQHFLHFDKLTLYGYEFYEGPCIDLSNPKDEAVFRVYMEKKLKAVACGEDYDNSFSLSCSEGCHIDWAFEVYHEDGEHEHAPTAFRIYTN